MELKDLVGEHILSGVDMTSKPYWGYRYQDCQVINFVLDGITYSAIEDPDCQVIDFVLDGITYSAIEDLDDGYRTMMGEIKVITEPVVSNAFPGQEVVARMLPDSKYEKNEVLEIIDIRTGKTVLQVGTANTDDYYPYFVAEFTPENMFINKDVAKEK